MTDLLTISALEARYGRDRRTVARLLRDVAPAEVQKRIKRYRIADVDAILSAPTPADGLRAAYEQLHAVRADLRALKRRIRRGELLAADAVHFEADDAAVKFRTAMMQVHGRYAGRMRDVAADRTSPAKKRMAFARIFAEARIDTLAVFDKLHSWEAVK